MTARLLATSPAGRGLCLVGGFRYRLIDQSPRLSRDVDYHWDGDIEVKQAELISLFQRRLLPEVKRQYGYEGMAGAATGPAAESPAVRTVQLAFWRVPSARIEIPVEITRIICLDPPAVRTADGVIYPTPSDADLIESKVIALFNRVFLQHRDLVDIFLFANHLPPDAAERIRRKFAILAIQPETVAGTLRDFADNPGYHAKAIAAVITDQLEPTAAANLETAGGAKRVLETVRQLLTGKLLLDDPHPT
jgi:hypothetical protein